MIILEKPYVSSFLEETALKNNYPVLKNTAIQDLDLNRQLNYWEEEFAVKHLKEQENFVIYSNSENSIDWIAKNLGFTNLPEKIDLFKDKIKFRNLISSIYPDFYFREISLAEIENINESDLRFPFIIKPSVGFLSLGVYSIFTLEDWQNVVVSLKSDIKKFEKMFPINVIDSSKFIIEEMIEGEEYAVDAYFDKSGNPVILNILKHPFSSEKDVSDRAYYTSKKIVEEYFCKFEELLTQIGNVADLKNFPVHLEVRVKDEKIVPIEINPMRFAGWCVTDLANHAYGVNIYEYYLNQQKPDWDNILSKTDDSVYYVVIGDTPSSITRENIASVDYEKFTQNFENLLELRKIDYNKHPLFAIAFAKTDNYEEITNILSKDFEKYIIESK